MHKKIKIIFLSLFLFSVLTRNVLALEDAIVAIVNDELITLSDLREYIKKAYVSLVAEGRREDEIRKIMLDMEVNGINNLIEDKIILSKANELGLQVRDKLIEERINDIKRRYSSDEVFTQALVAAGASFSDLRNKILEQLKIKYVIENEVTSKIFVNPQEVTDYYQKNIARFQTKEKIFLDSIYIPFDKDKEAVLKQINIARDLIKNGEDFEKTAKDFSKAASVGLVERGQLMPDIEKNVFHLKEETLSEVIETKDGAYIFRVKAKYPAQLASLEDVKDEIKDLIFQQKFKESFLMWLTKLKKEAYVEIKE